MPAHIWVSNARADSRLILMVTSDITAADPDRAIEAQRLNDSGMSVPPDMCPQMIWGDTGEPAIGSLPDVFYANGYWVVSARMAEVLTRFDLGGGALQPLAGGVVQADRTTRVPGEYFVWIFGNEKRAFLEQHSPKARPMGGAPTRDWCKMPSVMEDDAIAVSTAALAGPDVWVDPQLFKSIFVSGAVGDALGPKLRKALRLYRCQVM